MNVTELARQLSTTREELLEKLPQLGFDIGMRAIKIDNAVADRIKQAWSQQARKVRLKEKMEKSQAAQVKASDEAAVSQELIIPGTITVTDLAQKLHIEVPRLIGYLMKNGIMAALNEKIDFDTASIVLEDYGFKAVRGESAKDTREEEQKAQIRTLKEEIKSDATGTERPPVVVVMGHVDHGKTTLLDAIRKTNVVEGEAGGITQHIGAYQVVEKGRIITFLDTPGHEAFKAMRERGGQVADVAILVVAADDGLKPQTLESINVIQKENLPFVVAINKIDKPGADIDNVKKELAEINLNPEDWGGKTIIVPISAKKQEGIHELLDMVLLVSDIEKFTANSGGDARGVIIESHVSPGEGPVATVLITQGSLAVGNEVVIGKTYGKVKALKDWTGTDVANATPSMPVKILGLKSAPHMGDILRVDVLDRSTRKGASKQYRFVDTKETARPEETEEEREESARHTLPVIIKADVLGSLEALIASVKKLEREHVRINIIKQGLGNITESDVTLAHETGAVIYGFNVLFSAEALRLTYQIDVQKKISKIIYEIIDDVTERLKAFVRTETIEIPEGELHIIKVFKSSKAESIVGGRVHKANITEKAKFRLMREGEPIEEGSIVELQQNKQKVSELKEGVECGMKVTGARGIKEGDVLSCYVEEVREVV